MPRKPLVPAARRAILRRAWLQAGDKAQATDESQGRPRSRRNASRRATSKGHGRRAPTRVSASMAPPGGRTRTGGNRLLAGATGAAARGPAGSARMSHSPHIGTQAGVSIRTTRKAGSRPRRGRHAAWRSRHGGIGIGRRRARHAPTPGGDKGGANIGGRPGETPWPCCAFLPGSTEGLPRRDWCPVAMPAASRPRHHECVDACAYSGPVPRQPARQEWQAVPAARMAATLISPDTAPRSLVCRLYSEATG